MTMILLYVFIICTSIFEVTLLMLFPNIQTIEQFISKYRHGSNNETYNPYIDLNTPQIIRKEGYPSEAHVISTKDGYLLTLHRIPGKFKSHPVLVQHGLLGSSTDWVLTGPKKSLAFILADHGYDVWLGNFRGNTYSKAHKSLSIKDFRFWDFSWHEMGIYDLPAMISYITNLKQSNLTYIGHSMGTTAFYIMSALIPDIASKVQMMFSLAPVAYMKHMKSPLRLLAPFAHDLKLIIDILGNNEFLPHNELIEYFAKYGCDINILEHKICSNILFALFGFDKSQFNYTLIPVIFGHLPAGASTKTMVHYAQEIQSGKFQQFDYGPEQNLKIYNSVEPPDYDTSKISVPIVLYYANNDWCASVTDVLRLSRELKNVIKQYKIPYIKFNHLDFLWAIEAPELVYDKILSTMKGKSGSHPILVQHGLLASSADWVISGPKKGLAYLLADEGYDVWLGNFRGNTYSKAHKSLSTADPKFWNFSWHEMGIYDLPAMISYITNLKQSNLTYIGHSMGTTTFYVMSIMRQDIANKVQMMFSLAPVIYVTHMKSPIRFLAPFSHDLQFLARFLGQNEFLPHNNLIKFLAKYGCDMTSIETAICRNIIFLLAGFDEPQMNATLLPVILGHAPAGSSIKTFVHYLQEVNSGKFRQFDYGTPENLKIYNSIEPPDYNISKISVPIALYYSENDWFVNIKDLLQISMELKNIVDMYKIPYEKFNHIDFMWAINAPELVYSRILNTLKDRA